MDRLTASQVFVAVAEQGSLTQAADQLEMSTAMVSRYLAALEDWLGARLLHRTTRRLSLTEAGQSALLTCRQLLDLAEDLRHQTSSATRHPAGRLRIAAGPSFAEAQLTEALMAFQQRHPGVDFSLVAADRTVDLTAERVDLAVRIAQSIEPGLIARPLAVCRSVLCAAPAYLAAHGAPDSPAALVQHRCLSHAFVSASEFPLRRAGERVAAPIHPGFSTNETAVLRRAALAGAGIAMLPTYLIGADLRAGQLVPVLTEYEPETRGVFAVYQSRHHLPLALRLLVDFLAERFGGEQPPWDRA